MTQKTISLLICALGGEGAGVLTEWIIEAAKESGYAAQSTSIPGVAQRTGATTYYIEVFSEPMSALNTKQPLFSLSPVPGRLDCLLSSELLETARQCTLGLPSPKHTLTLSSSARTITTQERMELGDGRWDEEQLRSIVSQSSREHYFLDMQFLAKKEGTIVSSVMLGVIAGSGLFPIPSSSFEKVVSRSGLNAKASLRGFQSGLENMSVLVNQSRMISALLNDSDPKNVTPIKVNSSIEHIFPLTTHPLITLGYERLIDYQGISYAKHYLQQLQLILKKEQALDPTGSNAYAITSSVARWLALWMSFEDIIRVADLKSRLTRRQRVLKEIKASDKDMVKVYEHFKPGIAELAALLPLGPAKKLLQWESKRVAKGRPDLSLSLKLGSHTLLGFLSLRFLASLKVFRKHGFRYQEEHALIEQWLACVKSSAELDWHLGLEIAQCGQLIKGYGKTNERGKKNLLHILHQVSTSSLPVAQRIEAIAAIRKAALVDESGASLDQALQKYGAPAREILAQPIRWMKKPHH